MEDEVIFGAIFMCLCCCVCAITFLAIGIYAEKAKKPINFWSGKNAPAEKIEDVQGYNHANAVMWKLYSIPFWIAAIVGALGFLGEIYTAISAILLSVSCVPGLFFLIWRYRTIEKRFVKT